MAKVKVEVQCEHCLTWIKTPISFESDASFDTSTLEANTVRCPTCQEFTGCKNLRMRGADGGVVGNKL